MNDALREFLGVYAPDVVTWDGCDSALVGIGERCGSLTVAVYDYTRLVTHFSRNGMTREEAAEWVQVNLIGAYVGPRTPITLTRLPRFR